MSCGDVFELYWTDIINLEISDSLVRRAIRFSGWYHEAYLSLPALHGERYLIFCRVDTMKILRIWLLAVKMRYLEAPRKYLRHNRIHNPFRCNAVSNKYHAEGIDEISISARLCAFIFGEALRSSSDFPPLSARGSHFVYAVMITPSYDEISLFLIRRRFQHIDASRHL